MRRQSESDTITVKAAEVAVNVTFVLHLNHIWFIILNVYVNLHQASERMERCGVGGIRNSYSKPRGGFYMSRDFTNKMLYFQKTGHLLGKIHSHTPKHCGRKSLKTGSCVLLPKGVSMKVPRLKPRFSAHAVFDLHSIVLSYWSSTNLASELHCQQLNSVFLAGYCSISCQEQE